MKNWMVIVLLLLLIGASVLVGYLWKETRTEQPVLVTPPDRKLIAQNDSFNHAKTVKETSLERHKKKLSPYSRRETKQVPSTDSLVSDINTFQNITREQDTLIKIEARQTGLIRSELYKTSDQLTSLQNRYNRDIDRQKRTRVSVFFSGVGVGAGVILIAVLIF